MRYPIPRRLWLSAFCICLLAILVLALMKTPPPELDTGWDKSNHLLAFGVLVCLGRQAFPGRALALSIGLFAYGVSIEGLQALTDYRSADVQDLVADMLGVLLGTLLLSLGRFLASRH